LYEQAGALIQAGRFVEACPKLETSQRLDPGTGTLLRLGYCLEQLGRTASAWSAFNEAEAMARKANDKRASDAAARAKALEPKLTRLVIKPASPAAGEVVQRDGKTVDGGLWGAAVPVDPGEHTLEARAPGRRAWTSKIVVVGPGTMTVDVPVLVEAPRQATADTIAAPYWGPQRIAGVSVAGVGVVSAVVGALFGARALSKSSLSNQTCHPVGASDACDATGLAARHDAKTAATVSDVTLAVGAVGLAAGATVFFTAPAIVKARAGGVAPRIGVGAAGTRIVLKGAW
jgi:hypothetical protein